MLKDFLEKYELVRDMGSETIAEEPNSRSCRFCKKSDTDVSFNNKAHMVPELLGHNDYISFDECDECNRLFSKYENHLATFIRPYLAIMAIKTKSKIPTFQSRSIEGNDKTRTFFKVDEDGNRTLVVGNLEDVRNNDNGTFSIRFRKPPYRPSDVYKAFLKIGLSVLPDEHLSNYKSSINLILNKSATVNRIQCAYVTILTTSKFGVPNIFLYKKKEGLKESHNMPDFTLIIGTANLMFQVFLPYPDINYMEDGMAPQIALFPAIVYEKDIRRTQAITSAKDFTDNNTIEEDEWLTFTSSVSLNIPKIE